MKTFFALLSFVLGGICTTPANAQAWPAGPVTLVVSLDRKSVV